MTSIPTATTSALVARTELLPDGVDLRAAAGDTGLLFCREGAGLAGLGCALRIDLPDGLGAASAADRVASALAGIEVENSLGLPGSGPVAMGALPFDRSAPGSLVVPAVTFGRAADGTAWRTVVGDAGFDEPVVVAGRRPPDGFRLTGSMPHARLCQVVADTVDAVRSGRFEKVVLARQVVVEANGPILVADVLERLQALYPACTVFSIDGFVGASPERLVRRRGSLVESHPLAGTVARSGDPDVDARLAAGLMASAKDRHEHAVVVDDIASALAPVCQSLDVPDTPSIVPLRNVSHLGTRVAGVLASPAPSALALAALLHPTPAVAGTPLESALEQIAAVEGFPRDRYAGPVGWVDAAGDGEWVVGIRSASISGSVALLTAGVGIVADSDPEDELAETQLKLQALLAAVVRP